MEKLIISIFGIAFIIILLMPIVFGTSMPDDTAQFAESYNDRVYMPMVILRCIDAVIVIAGIICMIFGIKAFKSGNKNLGIILIVISLLLFLSVYIIDGVLFGFNNNIQAAE